MQFTIKVSVALAAASLALAGPLVSRQTPYVPCSGSYQAQCCATDVLGVADLNCATPPETPVNNTQFTAECSAIGQQARCCLLPILEQGIICEDIN